MDDLHADGAVAGFFCYPLDTLREEEGSQKIFDFRDKLEEVLTGGDGSEVLTLTGGATGLYCGYGADANGTGSCAWGSSVEYKRQRKTTQM